MIRLGLTGGIGSGKSTAAAHFRALGVPVIDADAVSRALTAPGGEAVPAIREAFGDAFVTTEGAMNRAAMRERFLADPEAKKTLEAILHPMIRTRTEALMRAAKGAPLLVYDCPLLLEKPEWRKAVEVVLVIDLDVESQIRRTMARSKLSREAVEGFIARQMPRERRLALADYVIHNGSDTAALLERVELLYNELTSSPAGRGIDRT